MQSVLFVDPDLGRVFVPEKVKEIISLPGRPAHMRYRPGEVGIFTTKQRRPRFRCGQPSHQHSFKLCDLGAECLTGYDLVWADVSHNERTDAGAVSQDALVFGSGTTRFTIVAIASAALTKTKTDLSMGTITSGVTTNEFTTLGLSRVAGSLGTYTAPASLGAQFTRRITKTHTASGGATAQGAALFDSATVGGSNMYIEDNYASTAVLVNLDTLTTNIDVSN